MNAIEQPIKLTPEQAEQIAYLKAAIEYAPTKPGTIAPNLRGWWTSEGWYLCARCAGRIMSRGCRIPGAEPVWADRPEPFGVCCCCE